ncbi:MAG: hypothetical protein LBV06_07080 [Propionibacteriaceae bacterium]|jgi:hypothetical protein|nr:hypothetical protein [Propionibacteriaceae bacterium]
MSSSAADAYMWAYGHIIRQIRGVLRFDAMTGHQAIMKAAQLSALVEALQDPAQLWDRIDAEQSDVGQADL